MHGFSFTPIGAARRLPSTLGLAPVGNLTMADQPSLSRQPEIAAVVRRWRTIIITLAFTLPMISVALELVTRMFPDSFFSTAYLHFLQVPRSKLSQSTSDEWFVRLLSVPLLGLVFNWPLLLFAAHLPRHITPYWPDMRAANAAMIGSTAGLLLLYGIFFVLLPDDSFQNAGAGVPFIAPVIWLAGWMFLVILHNLARTITSIRRRPSA